MIPKKERHSPSSLNAFATAPAMFVMERILGFSSPVGAAAHRGSAVEDGVVAVLCDGKSDDEAVQIALDKFDVLSALSGDPRKDKVRSKVEDITKTAINTLRPYGPPSSTQGFIEWKPEGLKYPIVGFYDFLWEDAGIVVDLKTTERCPSEVKASHARQVALYTGGNLAGRVAYTTPGKSAVYEVEDIEGHRQSLFKMAQACERFLALSDDPQFFASIIVPDVEHYFFADPAARQKAFEVFGI